MSRNSPRNTTPHPPEGDQLLHGVALTTYDKTKAAAGDPDYRTAMDARELGDRVAEALRDQNP